MSQTLIGADSFHALAVQDEEEHDVPLDALPQGVDRQNATPEVQCVFVSALHRRDTHQFERAPNKQAVKSFTLLKHPIAIVTVQEGASITVDSRTDLPDL